MEKTLFGHGVVDMKMSFTTKCSAHCSTCLNHTIVNHCKLEEDVFKKYINNILDLDIPNKINVSFYNIGEVYLHEHFVEWCEWAIPKLKKKGIKTGVVTNGSDITKIPKGIDCFEISFNAGNKKTYEEVTQLSFDKVYKNINRLYDEGEFKKARRVVIRLLSFDANAGQEEEFKRLFRRMKGVKYRISYLYDNQFGKTEYAAIVEREKRVPCEYLTNKVNLYPNGDINLCAHDFQDTVVLGNIKENSLTDILAGEKRMELLKLHYNGIYEGLCEKCNFNADRKKEYILTGYFDPLENTIFQVLKRMYRTFRRA